MTKATETLMGLIVSSGGSKSQQKASEIRAALPAERTHKYIICSVTTLALGARRCLQLSV